MKINNCLYICLRSSSSYGIFKSYGCSVSEVYKYKSRLAYRARYLCHAMNLELFTWLYEMDDEISNFTPELILLEGSLIYEPFVKKLRIRFPLTPIKYFYANIVDNSASISPKTLLKYQIEGYTWDINDSKRYSLNYTKPNYDINLLPDSNLLQYDACFVGTDKGRYKTVFFLKKTMEDMGLRCFVLMAPDYKFLKFLKANYSNPVSYEQYLEIVSKSKCIIDIVQKGQIGTTMRVMEAIFSKKKIISNNTNLMNYDFYNSNNIFILGKDNVDELKEFLNSDYEPIDEGILNEYKTTTWVKRIIEE